MDMLERVAMRLFGRVVAPYLDSFESLKDQMRKARMGYSLHEYLALVLFSGFAGFAGSVIFLTVFIVLFIPALLYSYTLAILISLGIGGMVLFFGYSYPSFKAKGLANRIDRSLPFAVFYMATTASSGTQPVNLFKMLTLRGGPIGEEASRIYTTVQALGLDLHTALSRAAARSPSPTFAELLWGMTSILVTGGNLEEYLKNKTKTAMTQYRRALDDYAKQIALYTEIYITLIIVGSVFFIILIAIISPLIGGNTLFLQAFLVFFFIPLVSLGFIMLLKGSSPTD